MPPGSAGNADTIDLTASDDETPSRSFPRSQPAPSQSGIAKNAPGNGVKQPPPKTNGTTVATSRDGARPSSQNQSGKLPPIIGGSSFSFNTPLDSQRQRNPKSGSQNRSDPRLNASHAKVHPLEQNPKPTLLNDVVTEMPRFKTPRGYSTKSQLSEDRQASDTSFSSMTNGQKRARDTNSEENQDSPRNTKRMKSESLQSSPDKVAALGRTDKMLGAALERSNTAPKLVKNKNVVDLTQSPPRRPPSRIEIDNTPSPNRQIVGSQISSVGRKRTQNQGMRSGSNSGPDLPAPSSSTNASKSLVKPRPELQSNGSPSRNTPTQTWKRITTGQQPGPVDSYDRSTSSPKADTNPAPATKRQAVEPMSLNLAGEATIKERSSLRPPKPTEKAKELGINRDRSTIVNGRPQSNPSKTHKDSAPDSILSPPDVSTTLQSRGKPRTQPLQPSEPVSAPTLFANGTSLRKGDASSRSNSAERKSTRGKGKSPMKSTETNGTPSKGKSSKLVANTLPGAPTKEKSNSQIGTEISINLADQADKEQDRIGSEDEQPTKSNHKAALRPEQANCPTQRDKSIADDAEGTVRTESFHVRDDRAPFTAEADLQLRTEASKVFDGSFVHDPADSASVSSLAAPATMSPLWSQMPLESRVEKVLGQYLEEMRGDNEYWTGYWLEQARLGSSHRQMLPVQSLSARPVKATSFAQMLPVKQTLHQKKVTVAENEQIWKVEMIGSNDKGVGINTMTIPFTTFRTTTSDVPNYSHFINIKNNFLAPNTVNLHCWPYVSDGNEQNHAEQNLADQYHVDIELRGDKLLLLQKAQKYEPYVESALQDLDCTWADVLRQLIESGRQSVQTGTKTKEDPSRAEIDNFSPTNPRSTAILSGLPASTDENLKRVEILRTNFEQKAKFNLWHIARRSEYAKPPETVEISEVIDRALTCRICLRFNCPYHGELNERPADDSDEDSLDAATATDVVHPLRVNYRRRMAFPPGLPEPSMGDAVDFRAKLKKRDAGYWRSKSLYKSPDERGPFYPCYHPGRTCEEEGCSCYEEGIPCEKTCSCAANCERRFQGCSCAKKNQRCFNDGDCICWEMHRECDPDLCGTCGVCEVLDPVNQDDSILRGKCRNGSIQRGVTKQTLLGDSGVHGFGLFACEDIVPHEFVGEYKGEIITKEEAERRGAVYEYQRLSYLFSLNATQEIDSTNFGNHVRFINHASGNRANLYPRIIMVNTVHRIALYAGHFIKAGQELFFDYGPKFPDEQLGGKKSKKSAPQARNQNLLKTFDEVEESEDEVGNLRARAVNRSTSGTVKPKLKRQRGVPSGPGRKTMRAGRPPLPEALSSLAEFRQDAGERLAAFNISEDPLFDDPMDVDKVNDDEDDGDEYREDSDDESEDTDATEEEAEQDGEEDGEGVRGMRSFGRRKGFGSRGALL